MLQLQTTSSAVFSVFFLGLGAALAQAAYAQGPEIISIDSLTYNGAGCLPGSVAYNLSPDRLALTLLFDNFIVATDEVANKSCNVQVALRVPGGWQYALFSLDTRGYADVDAGANGRHAATYRFGSGPLNDLGAAQVSGPYNADYFHHSEINLSANNWSPCNASTQNLALSMQMAVGGPQGAHAMMTIDSIDGSLTQHYSIRWRHCPSNDLNRRFVENLYADVLGRWASEAEINGWYTQVARGMSRVMMARNFLTSVEQRRYEVAAIYASMLGRFASAGEVEGWAQQAARTNMSSDDLLAAFASSSEFYTHFGASPQGFVAGLYRTILGRQPSPQEISVWVPGAIRNRAQVVQTFLTCPEARVKEVAAYYQKYLHRSGSPAEWNTWAQTMRARDAQETVRSQFMGSSEYFTAVR